MTIRASLKRIQNRSRGSTACLSPPCVYRSRGAFCNARANIWSCLFRAYTTQNKCYIPHCTAPSSWRITHGRRIMALELPNSRLAIPRDNVDYRFDQRIINFNQSHWVNKADRITQAVPIQIRIPSCKPNRIFGGPPADVRVIVAKTEPHQAGLSIV